MRFALIGCGGIGELRAAALRETPGASLTAVSDIDAQRAEQIAGGAAVTTDWRELLKRDDVDAIIVSTPPHLHVDMTVEALQAGKHVLCEKPLARNLEECQRMVDAATASGRQLATGFNYRFYPSILKASELLASGKIGKLDHIRSYTGYSATAHHQEWLHEFETMGGGALRDNGVHLIDLTCFFLGDVADVTGLSTNNVWQFDGCEDNGFALIRNRAGNIATLQASWTEWAGYRLKVEIYGDRGYIKASCFPMITEIGWATERAGKLQKKKFYFPRTFLFEHLKSYRWGVSESFKLEFKAFMDMAAGNPSAIASGADGMLAIEVAFRAAQNMATEKAATRAL